MVLRAVLTCGRSKRPSLLPALRGISITMPHTRQSEPHNHRVQVLVTHAHITRSQLRAWNDDGQSVWNFFSMVRGTIVIGWTVGFVRQHAAGRCWANSWNNRKITRDVLCGSSFRTWHSAASVHREAVILHRTRGMCASAVVVQQGK